MVVPPTVVMVWWPTPLLNIVLAQVVALWAKAQIKIEKNIDMNTFT